MKATRYQTDTADPTQFAPGQRWISETQAEFGLALILSSDHSQVKAYFPAVGETLTYASRNAPLRRVAFEPGDTVRDQAGQAFVVAEVREGKVADLNDRWQVIRSFRDTRWRLPRQSRCH
jgi:hypothetical protein